jgi:hypothetical protein
MSTNPVPPNESDATLGKEPAKARKEFQAWRYRSPSVANFTRQVHDFPNATVSINVGSSAGWVDLLAGITNISVGVLSSTDFGTEIRANQIVGTGIFNGMAKPVPPGQGMHAGSTLHGWFLSEYSTEFSCLNSEAATLLGNVQQITMVEPIDPAKLAQRAVLQECSLSAQLRRLRKLPAGWDGDVAPVISEATGSTAEEVIKEVHHAALSGLVVPAVHLGPLPDGTLRFECTYSNKELFLTISNKDIQIQAWQPLDAVESMGYWETDTAGVMGHLEWLVR